MPTNQRLGTDDREDLQDRWKPAIQLDEEPAIAVCEFDAPAQLAPQNDQLMSERGIFGLKPDLGLEWRGQGGQCETQKPDHSASLGDSVTPSTRIGFSVHTRGTRSMDSAFPSSRVEACLVSDLSSIGQELDRAVARISRYLGAVAALALTMSFAYERAHTFALDHKSLALGQF